MNSKIIFSSSNSPELSPKEYAVIRAYMLGLSESTLIQLLQIERFELAQIWEQLFEKFKQNNPYVLICRMIQMGVIEVDNYLPETIKSLALEFIHLHQDLLPSNSIKSEGDKRMCYHFLLKYTRFLEYTGQEKKIPPKRD